MIKLKQRQMIAFQHCAIVNFKQRLTKSLMAEYMPVLLQTESIAPPSDWSKFVDDGVFAAQQNAFINENHIKLFCELLLLSNGELDDRSEFAWVMELWRDLAIPDHIKCQRYQTFINNQKQQLQRVERDRYRTV